MTKEEILFSNAMMLYMADNIKSAKSNPSTLWNMVCHTFGIDTENEEFGKMFDEIWENNYIKTDILSLGSDKILELSKNKMKNYRLMIWEDAHTRNEGLPNEYNPQTCEMNITFGFEERVFKMENATPANTLDDVKNAALMVYDVWKPLGGCVEIVLDGKTLYHISEDSNHILESLTIA
jgi:hypothetical protein